MPPARRGSPAATAFRAAPAATGAPSARPTAARPGRRAPAASPSWAAPSAAGAWPPTIQARVGCPGAPTVAARMTWLIWVGGAALVFAFVEMEDDPVLGVRILGLVAGCVGAWLFARSLRRALGRTGASAPV